MMAERMFSVNSAAQLLDVGRHFIQERIRRGEIRAVNIADTRIVYRIPESELDRFVRSLAGKSPEGSARGNDK